MTFEQSKTFEHSKTFEQAKSKTYPEETNKILDAYNDIFLNPLSPYKMDNSKVKDALARAKKDFKPSSSKADCDTTISVFVENALGENFRTPILNPVEITLPPVKFERIIGTAFKFGGEIEPPQFLFTIWGIIFTIIMISILIYIIFKPNKKTIKNPEIHIIN